MSDASLIDIYQNGQLIGEADEWQHDQPFALVISLDSAFNPFGAQSATLKRALDLALASANNAAHGRVVIFKGSNSADNDELYAKMTEYADGGNPFCIKRSAVVKAVKAEFGTAAAAVKALPESSAEHAAKTLAHADLKSLAKVSFIK